MALQLGMGLLPEWRSRACFTNTNHIAAYGTHMTSYFPR
jgi:hypothetical protein